MYIHEFLTLFFEIQHWQLSIAIQAVALEIAYLILIAFGRKKMLYTMDKGAYARLSLFTGGVVVFMLAFGSPIDYMSDDLTFSVHMIQHMLEMMVMTPLLLAGMPAYALMRFFRFLRIPSYWFHPVATLTVFNALFFFFHIPRVYDESLVSEQFHFFEHFMFFIIAIFLWMPILSPLPNYPRLSPGKLLLYVFFAVNISMPGDIFLILAQHTLYAYNGAGAAMFGLTALADQQLGFVYMIVGMFVPMFLVAIYAFSRYDSEAWHS